MKKRLFILAGCCALLCAAGCCAGPAGESPSALPVAVAEDVAAALDELGGTVPALSGVVTPPSYLADLNGDGIRELYINAIDMSEPTLSLAVSFVQCCDPASGEVAALSGGRSTGFEIIAYEQALYIIVHSYDGREPAACRAALIGGALICEEIGPELQKAVLAAHRN